MSGDPKKARSTGGLLDRLNRSIRKRIYWRRLRRKYHDVWNTESGHNEFLKRSYESYEDYVAHQRSKLEIHDLRQYDVKFREALRQRLAQADLSWKGRSVLCLAARIGTEVKAFLDLGGFAVGIDLNPGHDNRYVVSGDFHELQYASESIDVIYTNSLDHAFDIHRIAREAHRVLKADGRLIVEAVAGKGEGVDPGFFESFFWSKVDDLASLLERSNFHLIRRLEFDYPWRGQQLWFEKTSGAAPT